MASPTFERLSGLLDVIESSAKSLREYLKDLDSDSSTAARIAKKLDLPFHGDSKIADQASVLRITCERLSRLVTPPRHLLFEAAGSFYTTLALQIVIRHDLATIIKEAPGEGISADDLASKCKLDAVLLARVLRYLTQHGIFQELEPGIFGNTVASLTMIDPEFRAHLDLVIYEGQLVGPHLEEYMAKRFSASQEGVPPPVSAFILYTRGETWYQWLHRPEHMDRAKNFNLAMRGMTHTEGLDFLPVDYPFHSFAPNTVLVDVGGGIGSLAELLLPAAPDLRFVVQDMEQVVASAHEVASPTMKSWIKEGKVKFLSHNFFNPQPDGLKGAVFILKNTLHNYPDSKGAEILRAIRSSEPSRLLIIDRLVVPLFRTEANTGVGELEIYRKLKEGGEEIPVKSQGIPTMYDLVMACLLDGRTRMLEEWRKLLLDGGFKLLKVYPLRGSTGQAVIEAIPI